MEEAEYIVHFQEGMEHHKAQWYDRRMTTVQELVKCKNCKRRDTYDCTVWSHNIDTDDDWFCGNEKRKE